MTSKITVDPIAHRLLVTREAPGADPTVQALDAGGPPADFWISGGQTITVSEMAADLDETQPLTTETHP